MGLSARVPSTLDTNKLIPEIFGKEVAAAAKDQMVCWKLIKTITGKEFVKGDTFYIPKSNTVSASEVVVGTPNAVVNPFNTSPTTLTINQWWDVTYEIDEMSEKQTQIDQLSNAREELSYALAVKVDSTVNSLFSALNGGTIKGADGAAVTFDVLLDMSETLNKNNVPQKDRFLVINPSVLTDLLGMEEVVNLQRKTAAEIELGGAGFVGSIPVLNCQIYMTNNLADATTGEYAVMFQREAIAGAMQENLRVEVDYRPRDHATYIVASTLWGVIEHRDTFGVSFYTRSR